MFLFLREALSVRLAIAGAVVFACFAAGAAAGPPRPNVLIVTIDTLRADRLSGYGYGRKTSPNIDRLLADGIRFDSARTVEPLTAPSLCSMLTSLYPHEHGSTRNGLRMREGLDSLPRLLQAHGYLTAAFVGNWTLKDKNTLLGDHFENYQTLLRHKRWFGLVSGEATADDINEQTLSWLGEYARAASGRPLMLWVHYVEPHAPYRLHEEYVEPLGIEARSKVSPTDRYDTEIADVDRAVGELIAGYERLLPDAETLIVFTSDHGESLGEHNYWGHGRHLYEPSLHVPLGFTWRGALAAGVVEAPALNLDVAPTIAALLGIRSPESFRGFDWSPVFAGREKPDADRVTRHQAHKGAVFSKHDSELARKSGLLEVGVVQGGTKEIFRIKNARHWKFDLTRDPAEKRDLTESPHENEPSERIQHWVEVVDSGLSGLDAETPEPLDEESVEQLRALGYAD